VKPCVGYAFKHTLDGEVAGTTYIYIAAIPVADIGAHNALNAVGQRTVKYNAHLLAIKKPRSVSVA
jgi:hypothetical protein